MRVGLGTLLAYPGYQLLCLGLRWVAMWKNFLVYHKKNLDLDPIRIRHDKRNRPPCAPHLTTFAQSCWEDIWDASKIDKLFDVERPAAVPRADRRRPMSWHLNAGGLAQEPVCRLRNNSMPPPVATSAHAVGARPPSPGNNPSARAESLMCRECKLQFPTSVQLEIHTSGAHNGRPQDPLDLPTTFPPSAGLAPASLAEPAASAVLRNDS
eukprot:TRINITY_DN20425_c0_g1_i1.p2 TRINITY_DN20425_c0_g1~~TRINITY_DN20425_c0_g1_i1.p2  ORF type:complete len:210 (-),score=51.90 TRINITY_DN20425_c0_g1_i1:338-967(-)